MCYLCSLILFLFLGRASSLSSPHVIYWIVNEKKMHMKKKKKLMRNFSCLFMLLTHYICVRVYGYNLDVAKPFQPFGFDIQKDFDNMKTATPSISMVGLLAHFIVEFGLHLACKKNLRFVVFRPTSPACFYWLWLLIQLVASEKA